MSLADKWGFIETLPPEEQDHARHIVGSLSELESYIGHFEAALSLFLFCRDHLGSTKIDARWPFVAARDGALTIFHFAKVMASIRSAFVRCPTFKAQVDHDKLREAVREFKAAFPQHEAVRHGVAHSAELIKSPDARDKNAAVTFKMGNIQFRSAGNAKFIVRNALSNDQFLLTIEGTVVSYRISRGSLDTLSAVRAKFLSGFDPL